MKSLILGLCLCFASIAAANAAPYDEASKEAAVKANAEAELRIAKEYYDKSLNYSFNANERNNYREEATKHYTKAANNNSTEAMLWLAKEEKYADNIPLAIFWYEKAEFAPGYCYLKAHYGTDEQWQEVATKCHNVEEIVPRNKKIEETIQEYQFGLQYYSDGNSNSKDIDRAIFLIKQAAAFDYEPAIEWLATTYFEGNGVPKDYKTALTYFEKLSSSDSSVNLDYMAQIFEQGVDGHQDIEEAKRFYLHAAEGNNPHAQQWIKAHPEVTKDSLKPRMLNQHDVWSKFPLTITDANGASVQVSPLWTSYRKINEYYPERAHDLDIEGLVTIECQFNEQARAEHCIVLQESPKRNGFGSATLKLMSTPFKMDNQEGFVTATKGKWFQMTIKWTLD